MKTLFWIARWISVTLIYASTSDAAEFSRSANSLYEPEIIRLEGPITYGDFERFKESVKDASRAIVVMDSPGGKLGPAIAIAQYIKAAGFKTYVENGAECRSACSVIWLAGVRKFLESGGVIGFHPPVQIDGEQTRTAPEISHALLGWALGTLGVPEEVVMRIYDGDLVNVKDYESTTLSGVGIDFTSLSQNALLQTLKNAAEDLSSAEYGVTLSNLKGQTPEPSHFPTVELVSDAKYGELMTSGAASKLTSMSQELQNSNLGLFEGASTLDLILKNTLDRDISGIVLACTICTCKSSKRVVVRFPEANPMKALSRIAFSNVSIQQIHNEFGSDQIGCLGAVAVLY